MEVEVFNKDKKHFFLPYQYIHLLKRYPKHKVIIAARSDMKVYIISDKYPLLETVIVMQCQYRTLY